MTTIFTAPGTLIGAAAFMFVAGPVAAQATAQLSQTRVPLVAGILGCAALVLWTFSPAQIEHSFALSLGLGWCLLVLAATDALTFRLPDLITIPLLGAGLAASTLLSGPDLDYGYIDRIAGAGIGFASLWAVSRGFRLWKGREGLGLGDAKLFGAAGAWLGWKPLPSVLLLACSAALLWVAVRAIYWGRPSMAERIPLGAALCLAFWVVWLYGPVGAV